MWSCKRSSFEFVMMPRSRFRAQDHLCLISHVRIGVLDIALRDFVSVISLFLSVATVRCCKRSSSGVATMPRSWIRAQDHFWLVYNVRIDHLVVALRDFVSVISLFLGAATMRTCRRTSPGLVMMPRSMIRAQYNLRLDSHVWIGVLGVAMRDFIGVIWLFIGAATMPRLPKDLIFFKKKKAGQGGLPPTSRRRGTICIFVSSFAIMAPYALRNRVCILLRNAENCKGCVIFKFEVHHEMQLQLGLKVRGLGTRY